jgi:hypothetical protein
MWWFGDCIATIGSFVPSKLVFLPETGVVSLRFGLAWRVGLWLTIPYE